MVLKIRKTKTQLPNRPIVRVPVCNCSGCRRGKHPNGGHCHEIGAGCHL